MGGLRPPFFRRTPMLCIGYAKSVPDEGSFSAEAIAHPPSLREGTLSHNGRGEECVTRIQKGAPVETGARFD
jgi:hypothetical protein